MLGREVLLPSTLIAKPPDESFRDNLRNAHETIRCTTHAVAKTQKTYFDRLVKGPIFAICQYVWLFWPTPVVRQKHRKLTRSWTGPFQILSFKSQVVCIIRHVYTGKRYTVHIDRLTLCHTNPSEFEVTHTNNNECSTEPLPSQVVDRSATGTDPNSVPMFLRDHQSTVDYHVRSRIDGRPQRQIRRPVRFIE